MTAPEQPTPPNRQIEDRWAAKLWLWKNGDHYLAFDSECPTYDGGDPKTLGEPIGFALLEWETYDRMTEQVAAQRAAEAVPVSVSDPVRSLVNDIGGCWSAFEYALREVMGNTNYASVAEKIEALRNVAPTPPPGDAGERARALVSQALRRAELCGTPHRMAAMPESIPAIDISVSNLRAVMAQLAAALQSERTAAEELLRKTELRLLEALRERDAAASQARREALAVIRDILAGSALQNAVYDEIARALAAPQESAS
jgi:hypothetical protein